MRRRCGSGDRGEADLGQIRPSEAPWARPEQTDQETWQHVVRRHKTQRRMIEQGQASAHEKRRNTALEDEKAPRAYASAPAAAPSEVDVALAGHVDETHTSAQAPLDPSLVAVEGGFTLIWSRTRTGD